MFWDVLVMFQECCRDVSGMFKGYPGMLRGCFRDVLVMFPIAAVLKCIVIMSIDTIMMMTMMMITKPD